MNIALEQEVFEDGKTVAVTVDGTRVAYIRPSGDGTVEITVIPFNEFGLSPIRQPRFKSNVVAAQLRTRREMKRFKKSVA